MNGIRGKCSLCGGDVYGHVGPWFGVVPPPPARCSHCGAVENRGGAVIPMIPAPPLRNHEVTTADPIVYSTSDRTSATYQEKNNV